MAGRDGQASLSFMWTSQQQDLAKEGQSCPVVDGSYFTSGVKSPQTPSLLQCANREEVDRSVSKVRGTDARP